MALKPFTVSQVSEFISRMFKTEPLLRPVMVRGEISSINYHRNGSIYLSLSDSKNKLDGVIFPNRVSETARNLKEGDDVILTGSIESYGAQSKYSLWVSAVEYAGEGELAAAFERMKKKLNQEGIFDKKYKKPLPEYPSHIGVVTSPTGAAVRDILKILQDRNPLVDITVFPVTVQGPDAAADITRMLNLIDNRFSKDLDLIILGRGGGSSEDLSVFNDEGLARAIFKCSIPIISAVGHEIDTSISDLVADVRAETPTAAAQMAVHSIDELKDIIDNALGDLNHNLANSILHMDFITREYKNDLERSLKEMLWEYERDMEEARLILVENDGRAVLSKGYALVSDQEGKPITKVSKLRKNGEYKLIMTDGKATFKVLEKEK